MLRARIIPVLLLKDKGLVKTVKFKKARYVGDPINAVKIFNDKGADELIFLDIQASIYGKTPDLDLIKRIANEAFVPFGYGGGIRDLKTAEKILKLGCEKLIINSVLLENPKFVKELADAFGSQSVVVSIDVKKNIFGNYLVYGYSGTKKLASSPLIFAQYCENLGAGEIIINSIDRDGTYKGYDIKLLSEISLHINVPLVALGGARNYDDFKMILKKTKVHSVAAGSIFVFYGPHKAVLIQYPNENEMENIIGVRHYE